MKIRRATIADLDALVPLFDDYRVFYRQTSDRPLARAFLSERMEQRESVIFVAEADGGIVGFTQLYPSFSSGRAAPIFILNDLFVTPSARGSGVATALLSAAAEFGASAGAVRLTLSTAADNLVAQGLYEGQGWVRETTFIAYNRALP